MVSIFQKMYRKVVAKFDFVRDKAYFSPYNSEIFRL